MAFVCCCRLPFWTGDGSSTLRGCGGSDTTARLAGAPSLKAHVPARAWGIADDPADDGAWRGGLPILSIMGSRRSKIAAMSQSNGPPRVCTSRMADLALAPDAGQCEPATAPDGPDVNPVTPAADVGDPADLLPLLEKVRSDFRAAQKSVPRRASSFSQAPSNLWVEHNTPPRRDRPGQTGMCHREDR